MTRNTDTILKAWYKDRLETNCKKAGENMLDMLAGVPIRNVPTTIYVDGLCKNNTDSTA